MSISKRSFELFVLVMLIFMPSAASAEDVTLLKGFSSLDGTVQFLPGAWVRILEDGKSRYYRFKSGQFVKTEELPATDQQFQTFNSGSVDYHDQISRLDYDRRLNALLPKSAKVKKIIEHHPGSKKERDILFVCYTVKAAHPDFAPVANDIYLEAIENTQTIENPKYKTLWSKELESNVSYGEVLIQENKTIGRILLLYWGSVAGSGSAEGLNIYKVSE